jgi:hypothetical protein
VIVGVTVGVSVGVTVGVSVGVVVGVSVGVVVGVSVGVFVVVEVGVTVGVGVGPLSELTTSPEDDPFLFHSARSCELPSLESDAATDCGLFAELTVVGLDHEVYGLLASEYPTTPLSTNQAARFDVAV